ncbi:MAG: protein-L-isoaspartate(D-aspartate) O-methyltransferase [Acidobacteria bacterium]|nr:protein-L-isoaspartate(D-aspartate) O-methyltransferase [Acidobacteriota bacterium]
MALAVLWALVAALGADPYAARRENMVRVDIQERGVGDARVLAAMRATPRHLFVPAELRSRAYDDYPLPIGADQTISQPYIVAYMSELLRTAPDQTALEIGTGSGYQAAVLSLLVKELYTLEIVPELARSAAEMFQRLGLKNVFSRQGDGYRGWPEKAPFDRILLTAAPPEVPPALLEQLKPGGRLVAPVGAGPFAQELVVVDKMKDGQLKRRRDIPVRFVPMVKGRK